jgi:sulfite exporter TauE/SafE
MTLLLSALALGIVGSGHCLIMCGPLVAAFGRSAPDVDRHTHQRAARALLYHVARIMMYAALGGIAGQAGYALALAGLGRPLAIAAAITLLAFAVGPVTRRLPATLMLRWTHAAAHVCGTFGRAVRSHPVAGTIGAGMANALLPCGLVYAALAAAAATGSRLGAVLFMTAFGVGTLPALVALSVAASRAPHRMQIALQKAAPLVLILLAALLILRGLGPVAAASAGVHVH